MTENASHENEKSGNASATFTEVRYNDVTVPRRPLGLDEITHMLEDIARNDEGAPRLRAIQMLRAQQQGGLVIPEPLSTHEQIDRAARVLRPIGKKNATIAFVKAFNIRGRTKLPGYVPPMDLESAPPELVEQSRGCTTVKKLYALAPHLKQRGFPRGFPARATAQRRAEWCQEQALRYLLEREQIEGQEIIDETLRELSDRD